MFRRHSSRPKFCKIKDF